jgi:two-component system cell cycle sensor histidine kinase/response regulator CckA
VLLARDGRDALQAASAEPADLLISDLVMPGMGGMELAARLRDRYPNLRVLFMSGYPYEHLDQKPRPELEEHFLQKPFSPGTLVKAVRELLVKDAAA